MTSSIFQWALKKRDPVMQKVLKHALYCLGLFVANIVNTLDPKCVVTERDCGATGGELGGAHPKGSIQVFPGPPRCVAGENNAPDALGDNAGPLDAVALARERLEE
jgi:predicted NBD/HSP70 family sugar kinase